MTAPGRIVRAPMRTLPETLGAAQGSRRDFQECEQRARRLHEAGSGRWAEHSTGLIVPKDELVGTGD